MRENLHSATLRYQKERMEIENKLLLLQANKRKLIPKNLNDTIDEDLFKEHRIFSESQIFDIESKLLNT